MSVAQAATIQLAPDQTTGGAVARDTQRIQQAIDAAHAAGGGVVELTRGTYVSGTLFLRSQVELRLAEGATLLGSSALGDYPERRPEYRSNTDRQVTRSLIYAEKQEDISITGKGRIDFNGGAAVFQTGKDNDPLRPFGIRFVSCRRVVVRGVKLMNSAQWLQHYLNCDDVTITGLTVYNHVNQNNDGIDIDGCRHVRVSDCRVDSDDDGICLKSNGLAPCEDVLVENCVVSSHCNPLKLGTETTGGFHRIVIRHCQVVPSATGFKHINGVDTALSAIALMIVDGGTLDDVQISDVDASESLSPIFIRLGNRARTYTSGVPAPGVGSVRNIHIRRLTAKAAGPTSSHIVGLSPDHRVQNVTLEAIRITAPGGGSADDATAIPPLDPKGYPNPDRLGHLPSFGLYARYVTGLVLKDVSIKLSGKDPRPAFAFDQVNDLTLAGVTAVMPGTSTPLIRLERCGTVEVLPPANQ
jgi:polygalacturonase